MFLRCSQKFLTELRLKKSDLIEPLNVLHPFDEWYGHVFFLYPRRKCAIFMHAQTGFCFFAFDRSRDQLNDINGLFRKCLGRALFEEHYPAAVIKLFNERLENVQVGRTVDRRVISQINQRLLELGYAPEHNAYDQLMNNESLAGLCLRRIATLKDFRRPIERMRDILIALNEFKSVEIPSAKDEHPLLEAYFETVRRERSVNSFRQ